MDLDPIKQLQSLLEDRGKVLEKISSIHSALGSSQAPDLAVPAQDPIRGAGLLQSTANSLGPEPGYARALQLLRDMQSQIEARVRPMVQQVIELEVAQIREHSGRDQATLNDCLARIDQCLVSCVEHIAEYQSKQGSLVTLNERLTSLGEAPEPLPEQLLKQDPSVIIQSRIEDLRRQGKL